MKFDEYNVILGADWRDVDMAVDSVNLGLSEVYENAKRAGIDDDEISRLEKAAKKVADSPLLKNLLEHLHYLLFCTSVCSEEISGQLPELENIVKKDGYLFNLILALSGVKQCVKSFTGSGFPEDVIDGAVKDMSLWVQHFKTNLNVTGLTTRILLWERDLLKGRFYRLGRMQYNIVPFHAGIFVYRNKKKQQVQALLDDGLKMNSSGQFATSDSPENWLSELVATDSLVTGNPVSPYGDASPEKITLNLTDWELALAPGDPVLDTHIPAGGSLNTRACAESIQYAVEFFAKYFPEKSYKGWACHSWFLDNQYAMILRSSSNIIKFQQEMYLFPVDDQDDEPYWRVFGEKANKDKPKRLPRNSSMQAAVATFIEAGGKLRSGGGFLLKEDLPWGNSFYRNM